MTIYDNTTVWFLQSLVEDPELMEKRPEIVQAARELLEVHEKELDMKANWLLAKTKGGGIC